MSKQILAITTCRVSSTEQLDSNSLGRQERAVVAAAKELGAIIPQDGQWSGSVSSKAGTNVNRKDLREMLEYCRKNKAVKYLIVDEVDRFMRSVKELFYFEVEFEQLGVKVWYATQPDLNQDDHTAKLLKAIEVFKAEGSNVERQSKSIKGQTDALNKGRWPFAPKPGYKRGYEKGIPEIHPIRGPILRDLLIRLAARLIEPSRALVELNASDFAIGHSLYKMDKFRKIVTDPFYAGVVEIDKQVKVRNENGLHEPLIDLRQHYELIKIMDDKKKTQSGPRKNGNPKYPVSNLVNCKVCATASNGRLVGYDHTNGKKNSATYEKYRCRACGRLQHRGELHPKIEKQFKDNPVTPRGRDNLLEALNIVWKRREGEAEQEVNRIRHKIDSLSEAITSKVDAATDPSNASIKPEILASIQRCKDEAAELEDRLDKLTDEADRDREQFLRFAFDFVENMGSKFLDTDIVSRENRLRCKLIVFPAGFWIDENNKVYTPEVSPLIRLANIDKVRMVRVRGL